MTGDLLLLDRRSAPPPPLPPVPTRAQVCAIQTHLQGLTYHTEAYGPIPAGWFWMLSRSDRQRAFATHRSVGDTHIPFNLAGSYLEPGTLWPYELRVGRNYGYDLPDFKAMAIEVIQAGLFPDIALAGDGMVFDPVGGTFGYDWLIANLSRILRAMRGDPGSEAPDGVDLTPYCIFRPGWDGCFYGWDRPPGAGPLLGNYGSLFRVILPNGYQSVLHTPGTIPLGGGPGDYDNGLMRHFDTVLSEFENGLARTSDPNPDTNPGAKVWMVVDRMVSPFNRPADMPTGPQWDPGRMPFYLRSGNPRGPYFYVAFEWDAYRWCRGQVSEAEVEANRAYLRAMGCSYVG